jgi:hypothetical protein
VRYVRHRVFLLDLAKKRYSTASVPCPDVVSALVAKHLSSSTPHEEKCCYLLNLFCDEERKSVDFNVFEVCVEIISNHSQDYSARALLFTAHRQHTAVTTTSESDSTGTATFTDSVFGLILQACNKVRDCEFESELLTIQKDHSAPIVSFYFSFIRERCTQHQFGRFLDCIVGSTDSVPNALILEHLFTVVSHSHVHRTMCKDRLGPLLVSAYKNHFETRLKMLTTRPDYKPLVDQMKTAQTSITAYVNPRAFQDLLLRPLCKFYKNKKKFVKMVEIKFQQIPN